MPAVTTWSIGALKRDLGFGAGRTAYAGDRRWWNVRPDGRVHPAYRIWAGPLSGGEVIDRALAMGETMNGSGCGWSSRVSPGNASAPRHGVEIDDVFGVNWRN